MADYTTIVSATLLLLALSFLTIEVCRRSRTTEHRNRAAFLFQGMTPNEALASNVGTMFSTTYFLGAVLVFSKTVGLVSILAIVLVCIVAYLFLKRLVLVFDDEFADGVQDAQESNLLAELIRKRLGQSGLRVFADLSILVYALLLVEEIAVSRAILEAILPGSPTVAAILLAVLCLVIVLYLYVGGFKAVLVSDKVQTLVLVPFLLILIALAVQSYFFSDRLMHQTSEVMISPGLKGANLFAISILGVAWFMAGIDYSSRLNFTVPPRHRTSTRLGLIRMSFLCIALTVGAGMVFAVATADQVRPATPPAMYVPEMVGLFLAQPLAIRLTFVVSVFCMIFTTIDTLLLALLQASHYRPKLSLGRSQLLTVLIVAGTCSSLVSSDMLYLFGIFAASLFVLPALLVLSLVDSRFDAFGRSPRSLYLALGITALWFGVSAPELVNQMDRQFLIPLVPLLSALGVQAVRSGFRWISDAFLGDSR